jgi:hypothetical protein
MALPKRTVLVVTDYGAVTLEASYWESKWEDGIWYVKLLSPGHPPNTETQKVIAEFSGVQFVAYQDEIKVLVGNEEAEEDTGLPEGHPVHSV